MLISHIYKNINQPCLNRIETKSRITWFNDTGSILSSINFTIGHFWSFTCIHTAFILQHSSRSTGDNVDWHKTPTHASSCDTLRRLSNNSIRRAIWNANGWYSLMRRKEEKNFFWSFSEELIRLRPRSLHYCSRPYEFRTSKSLSLAPRYDRVGRHLAVTCKPRWPLHNVIGIL